MTRTEVDLLFSQCFFTILFLQKSGEEVQFVVSRKSRPQTPDLIRSTGNEFPLKNASSDSDGCKLTPSRKIMERTVTIPKVSIFQQIAAAAARVSYQILHLQLKEQILSHYGTFLSNF